MATSAIPQRWKISRPTSATRPGGWPRASSQTCSFALDGVNHRCLATRGNVHLELHGVGAEALTRVCALNNLPLIVVVTLNAFTHKALGGQGAAIHQHDLNPGH